MHSCLLLHACFSSHSFFFRALGSQQQRLSFRQSSTKLNMQVLAAHSENMAPPTSTSGMEPPTKQQRISIPVDESFRVQRISEQATVPKRGSAKAAGYDLARCAAVGSGGVELRVGSGRKASA